MRRLIESGEVHSPTAAARSVVDGAYGSGDMHSKIARLVRTYLF